MTEILVQELKDAPGPSEACARFLDLPFPLLLESALRSERLGRFSYLAADPWLVLRSKGAAVEWHSREGVERSAGDPFAALQTALARNALDAMPGLPAFQGGAAGYLAYDLCHQLERLPSPGSTWRGERGSSRPAFPKAAGRARSEPRRGPAWFGRDSPRGRPSRVRPRRTGGPPPFGLRGRPRMP